MNCANQRKSETCVRGVVEWECKRKRIYIFGEKTKEQNENEKEEEEIVERTVTYTVYDGVHGPRST